MADRPRRKAEDALLLALACGATVENAARQAGLSERTVYKRLAEPGFRGRLQQLRTDMIQRTAGALTAAATESVRTLLDLQKSPSPASVRLGAARSVLEIGIKLREAADLDERLHEMEREIAELRAAGKARFNGTGIPHGGPRGVA
jgi:hypothetical protein